ncbi:MAG: dUTP diphosphatase [Nanoarchaeota archaeon]|nr:dUTP diphosphatase [Nanoarchaeota archaeon]
MEKIKIKIKKLHPDAILPNYAHLGDAGMDLYSVENITIAPGKRALVPTGITTEIPEGYVALIWDKSGLAAKSGIKTMAGVIDCHYRGEWKIVLFNTSENNYEVKKGEKIAQALIQPVASPEIEEVSELSDTSRGEGSFGSTGLTKDP